MTGLLLTTLALAAVSGAHAGALPAFVQARPVLPRGAVATGRLPDAGSVAGEVVLEPRNEAALTHFIASVSQPGSPRFRRYLPPGAFARRFGPTEASLTAVRERLRADGLRVQGTTSDGLLISFSGTSNRVERAFDTHLSRYRLSDKVVGHAPSSPLRIAGLGPRVAAIIGLDTLVQERPLGIVGPIRSKRRDQPAPATASFSHPAGSPQPCRRARSAAASFGGLTDDQIAHAYGAEGLYGAGDTGAGQRVAVYELEPFLRSDVRTFDRCYFGAGAAKRMLTRLHVARVDGGQPAGPGSGEAILDVEDVSAFAPGARIDVYEAPNTNSAGLTDYAAIIDADSDRVLTTSWGLCEQALQKSSPGLQAAENLLFEQAAAQGQTIFAAAGDAGSDDCNSLETNGPVKGQNPLSVDDPGSQPYVLSAGGTTIDDAATAPAQEHVWNDGANGGAGGGGISQSWTMPSWQRAATVPGIVGPGSAAYRTAAAVERRFHYPTGFCQRLPGASPATSCRLVPDVSAQADEYTGAPTFYSVSFADSMSPDGWTTIGGTSSAAPTWAGMLALVNASPTCAASRATRRGVGFASPLLYSVASDPVADRASFHDITAGNNDDDGLDNGATFPATRGYDMASGLGTPRLTDAGGTAGLAYYLCRSLARTARPTVTRLAPAMGSSAGGERLAIHGHGFTAHGRSRVAGVEIGTRQLSPRAFSVRSATWIEAQVPPVRLDLAPHSAAPLNGTGTVVVTVSLENGESSTPSAAARFTYLARHRGGAIPSVTALLPSGGSEAGGATIEIVGSGFSGARRVTFGGVTARFRVTGPGRISVTVPRFSRATACARLPRRGVFAHEDAANDICQVQVRVSSAHGRSGLSRIQPPLEGLLHTDSLGDITARACACELGAAPNEFDYAPRPRITSVSTSLGPTRLADENGGTLLTVRGVGLGFLVNDWADFGPPSQADSIDTSYVYLSGTKLQIAVPPGPSTVGPASIALRIRTAAGLSSPATVRYAGVPVLGSVSTPGNRTRLDRASGASDLGGTALRLSGRGLSGQILDLRFVGAMAGVLSYGTQRSFTAHGSDRLSTRTVQQNPALVKVRACTVSGCSRVTRADALVLYAPGRPVLSAISPDSGPDSGGTRTTLTGENLGCPVSVRFGTLLATGVTDPLRLADCDPAQAVSARSPSGHGSVPVTIETLESYFTRTASRGNVTFTYR